MKYFPIYHLIVLFIKIVTVEGGNIARSTTSLYTKRSYEETCTYDNECLPGYKCEGSWPKRCKPTALGSSCKHDRNCPRNAICKNKICDCNYGMVIDNLGFGCKIGRSSNSKDRWPILAVVIVTICAAIVLLLCCGLFRKQREVRRRSIQQRANLPSDEQSTSSTLQLLAELNDTPPEYSNVYLVRPQARNEELKPPSYEEAIRQYQKNIPRLH